MSLNFHSDAQTDKRVLNEAIVNELEIMDLEDLVRRAKGRIKYLSLPKKQNVEEAERLVNFMCQRFFIRRDVDKSSSREKNVLISLVNDLVNIGLPVTVIADLISKKPETVRDYKELFEQYSNTYTDMALLFKMVRKEYLEALRIYNNKKNA
jgi:hypothetical protein